MICDLVTSTPNNKIVLKNINNNKCVNVDGGDGDDEKQMKIDESYDKSEQVKINSECFVQKNYCENQRDEKFSTDRANMETDPYAELEMYLEKVKVSRFVFEFYIRGFCTIYILYKTI